MDLPRLFADTLQILWKTLIYDNNTLFGNVLAPFKVIAGFGFLYQFVPLYMSGLRNSVLPLTGWFCVLMLFLNNGDVMRKVAVSEYALARFGETVIKKSFDATVSITEIARQVDGDTAAVQEIQQKLNNCLAISPTIGGNSNPNFEKCQSDLKGAIQSKIDAGEIKDTSLKGYLLSAISNLSNFDLKSAASDLLGAGIRLNDDANKEINRLLFAGLRAIWLTIGDVALLLAVISLPFPLALAFFNSQGLIVWHGSFWGTVIFTYSMTIIAGAMDYFQAKIGASLPIYYAELAVAIVAPLLSFAIAAGGGIAVVKAISAAGAKGLELASKALLI